MQPFPFQYRLSFTSQEQTRQLPELIFVFDQAYYPELLDRLTGYLHRNRQYLRQLFLEEVVDFALASTQDVFNELCFGFANCGYVTHENNETHIHIRMSPHTKYLVHTIDALVTTLAVQFETFKPPNPFREVYTHLSLDTTAGEFHGYSVGGYLSCAITTWSRTYALTISDDSKVVRMHLGVLCAMCEVWSTVHNRTALDYIRGAIQPSGHFMLSCHGNACEIAVYPNQDTDNESGFVQLSSHNLDNAIQQLTLLAGLAKLCDVVRSS